MSARSRQISARFAKAAARAAWHARLGFAPATRRRAALARQARKAFEDLGPAFIKLGQLVSVRPDTFPAEWVFEMESLRDSVPATDPNSIRKVVEAELGAPVETLFAEWDDEPVASASIAQVHRARLRAAYRPVFGPQFPAGTEVAVKVVRPGVENAISADIEAARRPVRVLSRVPRLRHFGLPELVAEFSASLASECDLRREGTVADRFGFDLRDDALVVVPRVVWTHTTRRVLTTEFVDGWRLSELSEAERRGIDAEGLARHGAEVFMRQVLEIGRYHADLHPSNMLVTPDGRICYLDFGIVGRTDPAQRAAIAQVLVATVYRDAQRALKYSAELGLVVPQNRRRQVEARVEVLMRETLGARPRDVRAFATGFLGIMDSERVPIPAGYGLLIKALVTVEGVARALYPGIDIVETAGPYALSLVVRQLARPEVVAARLPDALAAGLRVLAG